MFLLTEGDVNNPFKRGVFDFAAIFLSVTLAILLVFSISEASSTVAGTFCVAFTIGAVYTGILYRLRCYRSAWRFFSSYDAMRCFAAAIASTAIAMAIWFSFLPVAGWLIVGAAATFSGFLLRCSARLISTYGLFRTALTPHNPLGRIRGSRQPRQTKRALMIGYGDNLEAFLRSRRKLDTGFEIVGIVRIAGEEQLSSLRGIPILGSIDGINAIVRDLELHNRAPDMLILTRDELRHHPVAGVLSQIDKVDAEIAWLPRLDQLDQSGEARLLPIKLEDLLSRPAKSFDAHACEALLSGVPVLITGAGGSIGSELVRQIAALSPSKIILADSSEHALYQIDREMSVDFPNVPRVSKILNVRDRDTVFRTVERYMPEFIFHAAALKHVPIVEGQPCEGLLTNVVGSWNVADAAAAFNVRTMVMVSTDKAVNPANVMGATKRMAETYCQAMDADMRQRGGKTRFVTVRFGNVLGSNGSVVPLFERQLAQGRVLTVTHPDVERFFMTIPEASRLILEAMLAGMDDEKTEQGIFVLDMGRPVKIVDLARQVIRLSGLRPDADVRIVYTGLRPGEKLYEELMHETESLLSTDHASLMIAQPRFVQLKSVQNQISVIAKAAEKGDEDEVVRLLKVYIPEFGTTANEATRIRQKKTVVSLRDLA